MVFTLVIFAVVAALFAVFSLGGMGWEIWWYYAPFALILMRFLVSTLSRTFFSLSKSLLRKEPDLLGQGIVRDLFVCAPGIFYPQVVKLRGLTGMKLASSVAWMRGLSAAVAAASLVWFHPYVLAACALILLSTWHKDCLNLYSGDPEKDLLHAVTLLSHRRNEKALSKEDCLAYRPYYENVIEILKYHYRVD